MKFQNKILIFVIVLLGAFFIIKKSTNSFSLYKKNKISIVCSTSIIADCIKNIIDDDFEVFSLMGPGIDPHLYKPTPQDIFLLNSADIVIYNGLHLEGKMADIFESLNNRNIKSYGIGNYIEKKDLIQTEYDTIYDPHIWFDVIIWIDALEKIKDKIIECFPNKKNIIEKKWNTYRDELIKLDRWIHNQVEYIPLKKRIIITAHDAFKYFGKRYCIQVEGLQGISTDSEVTIGDIERISKLILENNIRTIFVEQTISHEYLKNIQTIISKHNHCVNIGEQLFSDALGENGTGGETYISMIQSNVIALVKGLQ